MDSAGSRAYHAAMSRLLILNLGTYAETHRFKAFARDRGYLDDDALDTTSPGALVQPGGVQRRSDFGAAAYSFYGLEPKVWKGTPLRIFLDSRARCLATCRMWFNGLPLVACRTAAS